MKDFIIYRCNLLRLFSSSKSKISDGESVSEVALTSKRTSLLILCFLFVTFPHLVAQPTMQNVMSRERLSLNGEWAILLDPFANGEKSKWYAPKDSSNKNSLSEIYYEEDLTLQVPGDWNHQIPELFYYEGDVWYKRLFDFDAQTNNRQFIYFGAVAMHCTVYLNGEEIGRHKGGFTPFQFEVTDKLKEGSNSLILRVDNRRSAQTIPALNFDWWNYGGITRDVDLVSVPRNFIRDYTVRLNDNQKDELYVEAQLDGADISNKTLMVSLPKAHVHIQLITDENGFAATTQRVKLDLWSPENPTLYDVHVESCDERIDDRIGFRTIEVRGEDILLNGEPIFLRGINIHEEIASEKRRSSSLSDAEYLISQAEELGCNFIRLSHYPHNEYMVRLAEERGVLMWEEIPVWQLINFKNQAVCDYAERMMVEMIERDKNRCGIILWSISNETFAMSKERNEFLISLAQKVKEIDNSRLVTSALHMAHTVKEGDDYYMELDDPLIDYLDVVGINKYVGWYMPFPCPAERLHWRIATGKPVIMSEFGAECVAGNHQGDHENLNSWSEEYMSNTYSKNIVSFGNFPNLRGTSPWILFDFRSPRRPHAKFQQGWNRKGLISPDGQRKEAWYVMRDYYKSKM